MSIVKEPAIMAPWPPAQGNDGLYRWPFRYAVGKERGESFGTIAKKHGVRAADLVYYNFLSRDSKEINWYLANYVGCPAPRPGQQYYTFDGAVQDEKKNTGFIFVPKFGSQREDYLNKLGNKIVDNYNGATKKEPGGRCYEACYARVRDAARQVAIDVPALSQKSDFGRLWGSLVVPKKTWLELPEDYRGKGAPGAMASEWLGTLVDSDGIWAGKLKPGAVIQTWRVASDFERVKDGDSPISYGHSFIFLNYVYSGSAISAMAIADQGFQNDRPLTKGAYGYWVGANL